MNPVNLGDDQKSSAPNTSSSGSTANTLSSMETVELSESACFGDDSPQRSQSDERPQPFGHLFPLSAAFKSMELVKMETTFGRGDCDYSFNAVADLRSCKADLLVYSKFHFTITRENMSTGWHTFLTDLSTNGTFVNGAPVGKGNRQALNNNDEIALATKKNKAFVYMDVSANNENEYPSEINERGACGEVRLAFEKGTCTKFAVKIIAKKTFSSGGRTRMNQNLASQVMNEVRVLKALKHPCIVKIEDVIDTSDTVYIVLELMQGGELFDRVNLSGQLPESTSKLMFYQMVTAIKYLHEQGISHRDLKPENILLAEEEQETLIKVTDFGLSKFVDGNTMMKTFCGTPNYLAPEVLLTEGSGSYTQAVDCWSLGVILYICLGGYPPFTDEIKDMSLKNQILNGRYSFPKLYWKGVSDNAIDMIKRLLTVDPEKRLTLQQALEHPWLKDSDMLEKAHKLMFQDSSNGSVAASWEKRTLRPQLKRQRDESDETVDGEDEDGDAGSDSESPTKKQHLDTTVSASNT